MDTLMSVQEVAERLGVSLWTVYRLARSKRLGSVQLGRRRLFTQGDVEELVRASRVESEAPKNASSTSSAS
jgi:excisionase family DNA binding protein